MACSSFQYLNEFIRGGLAKRATFQAIQRHLMKTIGRISVILDCFVQVPYRLHEFGPSPESLTSKSQHSSPAFRSSRAGSNCLEPRIHAPTTRRRLSSL